MHSVDLSLTAPPSVTIASPGEWASTARSLRTLPAFGTGALESVTLNTSDPVGGDLVLSTIVVDETAPDEGTLTGLAAIVGRPGVASFSYDPLRPRGSGGDWRPVIAVSATDSAAKNAVARLLSAFPTDADAAPAAGVPRAAYTVFSQADETGSPIDGYLGLPHGAPEPDDLAPVPGPELDPAIRASVCARNEDLVRAILDEAGDLAGIHGTPVIESSACGAGAGTEVQGRVTIPIFDIADTADPAYNSIVASWNSQGYTGKDRAGPLELRTGGPLKLLAISGGQRGISITATSY